MRKNNQKYSIKAKIKYLIDNLILENNAGLVIFLVILSMIIILILSIPVIINSESTLENLWNNFATAINAWWPFSGEGEDVDIGNDSLLFVLSKTTTALFGLFLVSALIGYISEKISSLFASLKKGKSHVIEENHIIIVGYDFNNHTLIEELIKREVNSKILIIDDEDISLIKDDLETNIYIPKGVKIIYRSINITSTKELEKCSIERSQVVVIQPMDDIKTLKAIMAIKKIINDHPESKTHIISAVNNEDYLIKFSDKKDIMISTNSLLARTIAASNYEDGISKVMLSLFSFDGSEFYLKKADDYLGLSFGVIVNKMSGGVPIGILRENKYNFIPSNNTKIERNDELLVYTESKNSKLLLEDLNEPMYESNIKTKALLEDVSSISVLVIGYNEKFEEMYNYFDLRIKKVIIINILKNDINKVNKIISKRKDVDSTVHLGEVDNEELLEIIQSINHIIIISQDTHDKEQSDVNNLVLYLRLNKLREKMKLKFTIITELNYDQNRVLIDNGDKDDFMVSTNIISMMLAQMVEDYRMKKVFIELLSNGKIGLYIDNIKKYNISEIRVSDLRSVLLHYNCVLLGFVLHKNDTKEYIFNPDRNLVVKFSNEDEIVLIKKDSIENSADLFTDDYMNFRNQGKRDRRDELE